jgi:hypothetical protein
MLEFWNHIILMFKVGKIFLSCVIKALTVVIQFLVNIKGFTEITS